jgi:hypothetical protein
MGFPAWVEKEPLFDPIHEYNSWVKVVEETGVMYAVREGFVAYIQAHEWMKMAVRVTAIELAKANRRTGDGKEEMA